MERAFAELIRHSAGKVEWTVVSSVLQEDLRPLVTWKRIPTPAAPAPLRFVLFWLLAGARIARLERDVLHTLGAITWTRADLVTVQFCHAAFARIATRFDAGAPLARRLNTRLHGALALWAERFCFRSERVRMFAAVSPGVARELEEHYASIPVVVTPNGVDAERFRPDREERAVVRAALGSGPEDIVAIFVGGDWRRKGLAVAIGAVAIAAASIPPPARLRLWVVGDGDPAEYQALAGELGVADQVVFLGRRADVERCLQAADVFVFPTSYETFSIASYEAAASEIPVLATPVSGIEDLIGADETGIAEDAVPERFGDALGRLATDPTLRRRLGAAGRRRACEYPWERSAASVLDAYAALQMSCDSAPVSG